jgi:protein-tyrosine-phosphatase
MPEIGASDGALLVALEHGIDLGGHRAQPLTRELIESADLVLAMGDRHLVRVDELGGAWEERSCSRTSPATASASAAWPTRSAATSGPYRTTFRGARPARSDARSTAWCQSGAGGEG